MTDRFTVTNEAINNMSSWLDIYIKIFPLDGTDEDGSEVLLNRTGFISRLEEFRNQITAEENRENNVFEVGHKNFYT